MKEVRVCEAMKSPVGTLSDGTVLHQQDGGTKVPTSSDLGEKQSDAGRSRSLFRHWYQQAA